MIIDFHTHAFADAIAPRAIASLSKASGGLTPSTDGTAAGLLRCMDECGVDHSVLLTIATKPKQQKTINDWAAQLNHGRISAFGSIHPDAPDALDELERIHALGLRGVKSHVRNWRWKGHLAPLMRPTKFPEIPVSLERNTEVFRHPLL